MKTGNRLRVVRADKRVTQEQIETRTKKRITQTRVSQIENGSDPTPGEMKLIARALRVPVEDVFPPMPEQVQA
jgi:transcriptional regulator with XRE-family HTH domain